MIQNLLSAGLVCAVAALGLTGCGSGISLFYKHPKPQAIQRDTVTASGAVTSFTQNPQNAINGTIKITPVELLNLQPVTLQVDSAMASANHTYRNPRTLMAPPGFSVSLYAVGLGKIRDLMVRDDGTIFYSDRDEGRIVALGTDRKLTTIATGLKSPHGIELANGALFYTDETRVFRYDFSSPAAVTGTSTLLTDKLPVGGSHYTRTIRWVPADKRFYISIGSISNNNEVDFNQYAAVVRMSESGGKFDVVMRGLRDAVGMDVHPETGELWATDYATEGMGADLPPDEINILRVGRHYGWPYYYSDGFLDPDYMKADSTGYPRQTPPVVQLQAHSTPTSLRFYTGTALGADWKNAMIVVQHGPRFDDPRDGSKVIRVRAGNDGSNARQADFITGFVVGKSVWGYPTSIAIAKDGVTFYLSDESNGAIYKISKP